VTRRENAARRRSGSSGGIKTFYYVLAVVGLLGAVLIGSSVMKRARAATAPPKTMPIIANAAELMQTAKGVMRGQNTAPVKLLVFADYMCPACAYYTTTLEPQIKALYIDTGKAVEIFYDFPLGGAHVHSFLAARAARCAEDQGKFWEYHDNLFAKQKDWSYGRDAPVGTFKTYAGDVGLDRKKFDACLDSDTHSDLVEYNHQLGEQAGVGSTPTVFINGKAARDPLKWDLLKEDIDAAVGAGK
jgi:protein-disulfide isomerase